MCVREKMVVIQDIFYHSMLSLYVFAFETLTPATLGKWASTCETVFLLGKDLLLDFAVWIDLTLDYAITERAKGFLSKDFAQLFFLVVFFRVMHETLSERRLHDNSWPNQTSNADNSIVSTFGNPRTRFASFPAYAIDESQYLYTGKSIIINPLL